MQPQVRDWMARRTYDSSTQPPVADLVRAKRGRTIALLVPALNEARTVGGVVGPVCRDEGMRSLIDDVVVVDGGSVDDTAAVASAAGARVVRTAEIAQGHPAGGKGGSMWRGLQATSADLLVAVDADLDPFDPIWVARLVGPLLVDDRISFVKAAADRALLIDGARPGDRGGRVTELVARPLINALWPELAGVVQPLAGEIAARRSLLERLPFAAGYGLEIGMLIDTLQLAGLDALAQVDLGERRHRHQSDLALAQMASTVLHTALRRRGIAAASSELVQFVRMEQRLVAVPADVEAFDFPATCSTLVTVTDESKELRPRARVVA